MNSRTTTLIVDAPQRAVFDFLSRVENLPRWAVNFCQGLRRSDDAWRVVTPEGEILFRIDADAERGIVDMRGGPSEAAMAYWPTRIVALPDGRSAVIFTNFQWPGVSDAAFERQCDGLAHEFQRLREFVER